MPEEGRGLWLDGVRGKLAGGQGLPQKMNRFCGFSQLCLPVIYCTCCHIVNALLIHFFSAHTDINSPICTNTHAHTHMFITLFTNGNLIITPPACSHTREHSPVVYLSLISPGVLILDLGGCLCAYEATQQSQTNCINKPREELMILTSGRL